MSGRDPDEDEFGAGPVAPCVAKAIRLLRAGEPLPVDLQADVLAAGYDVSGLEDRFAS